MTRKRRRRGVRKRIIIIIRPEPTRIAGDGTNRAKISKNAKGKKFTHPLTNKIAKFCNLRSTLFNQKSSFHTVSEWRGWGTNRRTYRLGFVVENVQWDNWQNPDNPWPPSPTKEIWKALYSGSCLVVHRHYECSSKQDFLGLSQDLLRTFSGLS